MLGQHTVLDTNYRVGGTTDSCFCGNDEVIERAGEFLHSFLRWDDDF